MKFIVIDNFLSSKDCEKLIIDANTFTQNIDFFKYHGNREDITSSSLAYNKLLQESLNWKNLANKLNSEEFFKTCFVKLNVDNSKFLLRNFFNADSLTPREKVYKNISSKKLNLVSTKSLIKYTSFRVFRDLLRKIKFSKFLNYNKKPLELLYNFAKAGNGYKREIHRDSDSRLIVFVLYLNKLSENGEGGTFDIYRLIKKDNNLAQPDHNSCEKIQSIKPEIGKLVMFLNQDESYHAVTEMKNFDGCRYFIYGSFTLLNHKNNFIKNKSSLNTDYHNYE